MTDKCYLEFELVREPHYRLTLWDDMGEVEKRTTHFTPTVRLYDEPAFRNHQQQFPSLHKRSPLCYPEPELSFEVNMSFDNLYHAFRRTVRDRKFFLNLAWSQIRCADSNTADCGFDSRYAHRPGLEELTDFLKEFQKSYGSSE